jgi:hypothetical protein
MFHQNIFTLAINFYSVKNINLTLRFFPSIKYDSRKFSSSELQIIFVNSRPAKVWFGNLFSRQLRVNASLGKTFRPFLAKVLEENFTLLGNSPSTQKMSDDIHEENQFPSFCPYIYPVEKTFSQS